MGEAKRKQQAMLAAQTKQDASVDPARAAAAVHQVVQAVTDFHGADCLLYAHIGAELLRSMGLDAQVVAGSAAWRVGSGDSDVISHAREISGMKYSQADEQQSAMFHAWIEAPGLIIDFSTATLRNKAAQLDAADGGSTQVDWCPDYIWQSTHTPPPNPGPSGTPMRDPKAVLKAADAGAFNYTRHADIEAMVISKTAGIRDDIGPAVFGAQAAYAALCRGETINVIGLSPEGMPQSAPPESPLRQRGDL